MSGYMIVIRPNDPRRGSFKTIYSDGKPDPTGTYMSSWSSWSRSWPEEFICGALHFNRGKDELTITEKHLHILHRRGTWTWLDLLPLDMRRAVLEPMCRVTVLSRLLTHDDMLVQLQPSAAQWAEFAALCGSRCTFRCSDVVSSPEGDETIYPCSLYELIDRWVRGCGGTCACVGQHGNGTKVHMRFARR